MNQEILKNKLIDLVEALKDLSVADAVKYIEENFPEKEYKWEHVYETDDFYIDHHDTVFLSDSNLTQLTINYPGGDRLGSMVSEPYTNIQICNTVLEENNNFALEMYLFLEDKYNVENHILEYIDDLVVDYEMTAEEIINALEKSYDSISLHLLEQLSNEQLQNKDVVKAIVDCVENVAWSMASKAYDQYQYGQYGGEDVADWELSKSSQFKILWDELPELVKLTCHKELEEAWLQLPDTKKNITVEQKSLIKKINSLTNLNIIKTKYIQDVHNRYQLLDKYNELLKSNIKELEIYPLIKVGDMRYSLNSTAVDNAPNILKQELKKIELQIEELMSKNGSLDKENDKLFNEHSHFWQQNRKQDIAKQITENSKEIDDNKEAIFNLEYYKEERQSSLNMWTNFQKEIEEMNNTNDMKDLPSLYWDYELLTVKEANLNNYSKADYIDMIENKIESVVSELEQLKKELVSKEELLTTISALEEGNNNNKVEITKTNNKETDVALEKHKGYNDLMQKKRIILLKENKINSNSKTRF